MTDPRILECAKALAKIEFKMPGAGGLRGILRLAPAQAEQLALACVLKWLEQKPSPRHVSDSRRQRDIGHC